MDWNAFNTVFAMFAGVVATAISIRLAISAVLWVLAKLGV